MTKILVVLVSFLVSVFAGATVAAAQTPPPLPACDSTYLPGSCEDRACRLEREVDRMLHGDWCAADQAAFDQRARALQARVDNLAGCIRQQIDQTRLETISSMMANLPALCRGEPVTVHGQVVTPPPPVSNPPPPRRERDRDRRPEQPPRQPETPRPAREPEWRVDCLPAMGVHMTATGCECIETLTTPGGARRALMTRLNIAQRTVGYSCPADDAASVAYVERVLDRRLAELAAQRDRDLAAQRERDEDQDRATAEARRMAERALRERILSRVFLDFMASGTAIVAGISEAPSLIGLTVGARFRVAVNRDLRDEVYIMASGGFAHSGNGVGRTALLDGGLGYTRYFGSERTFGLSFGLMGYTVGIVGEDTDDLEGALRRWGAGGEFAVDVRLTDYAEFGGQSEVRLRLFGGVAYDRAYWHDVNAGLMFSEGPGFRFGAGIVGNF